MRVTVSNNERKGKTPDWLTDQKHTPYPPKIKLLETCSQHFFLVLLLLCRFPIFIFNVTPSSWYPCVFLLILLLLFVPIYYFFFLAWWFLPLIWQPNSNANWAYNNFVTSLCNLFFWGDSFVLLSGKAKHTKYCFLPPTRLRERSRWWHFCSVLLHHH